MIKPDRGLQSGSFAVDWPTGTSTRGIMTQGATSNPVRFGIVGRGWRSAFYRRLALALPEHVQLVGVMARSDEAARSVEETWKVRGCTSIADLLALEPEFVISAVPWAANPGIVLALTSAGVRVLTETPPAPDLDGLRSLWKQAGEADLIQVAEQYLLYPGHAARSALLATGLLGRPSSVQVSSTHLYHAVSMIRGLLGVGLEDASVRANAFHGPLVDPQKRDGWTDDDTEKDALTTLATIEFASGAMGLYDFTDNQWHNPLRSRRIVIRASRGEISNDAVVRLADSRTVLEAPIVRRQTGWDLNLEGFQLDHLSYEGRVLYRNPFPGLSLSDEDIATAMLLVRMARWSRGQGPAPYPLAEGCQDHAIALAIQASARDSRPVSVSKEDWVNG
ncbi:MAG TPA: Gfo/Idh/MocA family oxidoreductase [Chloroflexota bacterium]